MHSVIPMILARAALVCDVYRTTVRYDMPPSRFRALFIPFLEIRARLRELKNAYISRLTIRSLAHDIPVEYNLDKYDIEMLTSKKYLNIVTKTAKT